MLRTRVVRELLFDVAGLRRPAPPAEDSSAPASPVDEQELLDHELFEIETARKRAFAVVVLDAVALTALLVLRDPARGLLALSRSEEMLFTLGALLVAGHLGFRLAQGLVLRNLERAWEDLPRS